VQLHLVSHLISHEGLSLYIIIYHASISWYRCTVCNILVRQLGACRSAVSSVAECVCQLFIKRIYDAARAALTMKQVNWRLSPSRGGSSDNLWRLSELYVPPQLLYSVWPLDYYFIGVWRLRRCRSCCLGSTVSKRYRAASSLDKDTDLKLNCSFQPTSSRTVQHCGSSCTFLIHARDNGATTNCFEIRQKNWRCAWPHSSELLLSFLSNFEFSGWQTGVNRVS